MGVNYTLKNVSVGTNTIKITKDIDAEVKNIKDFVSKL
jgi:flagellar hook-associated protein 2